MKEKWLFIHGGWGGSWQWTPVIELLNNKNIESFAPTMPGMGMKSGPDITLDHHLKHIELILDKIEDPITITAFSFGGLLATALAGKYPERINRIFYVDAFVPLPGQSYSDIAGEKISRQIKAYTDMIGGNNMIPPFFETDTRYCSHPLHTLYTKVNYDPVALNQLNPVYIECTDKDPNWTFTPILEKTAKNARDLNWQSHIIKSDHMPMYSHSEELCNLLFTDLKT